MPLSYRCHLPVEIQQLMRSLAYWFVFLGGGRRKEQTASGRSLLCLRMLSTLLDPQTVRSFTSLGVSVTYIWFENVVVSCVHLLELLLIEPAPIGTSCAESLSHTDLLMAKATSSGISHCCLPGHDVGFSVEENSTPGLHPC